MINYIKSWLAWKVAKAELIELAVLKSNVNDLRVWCSHNKDVSAAARWLENNLDYPCQYRGARGSIEDVRAYLDKLDKEK